jgi:hypothetical protein
LGRRCCFPRSWQQRRAILRARRPHTHTDAHSNCNSYPNSHSLTYSYRDAFTYTYADAMHRQMCANAAAASDSSASSYAMTR